MIAQHLQLFTLVSKIFFFEIIKGKRIIFFKQNPIKANLPIID